MSACCRNGRGKRPAGGNVWREYVRGKCPTPESMSGPGVPERGTGPTHARHTARGPIRPVLRARVCPTSPRARLWYRPITIGTDRPKASRVADSVNPNVKNSSIVVRQVARDVEGPEHRSEKPESTESPVREGKRPGLVPDIGYGPSLWSVDRGAGYPETAAHL